MVDGLSHLLTLRKQGLRPASVWLSIDVPYRKPKFAQDYQPFEMVAHGSVLKDDFRAFKGLQVTFYAPKWTDLASECMNKLMDYADEITVLCCDYGLDIGYFWSREYGAMDFGIIGWIEKFHEARTRLCRTDAEVAERVRIENECLAKVPNLRDYRGDTTQRRH